MIVGLTPVALWIARTALTRPADAANAAGRVAAMCRQVGGQELASRVLWETAAELFDLCSTERPNGDSILARTRQIRDDSLSSLRVTGYVLASGCASVDDAIHCQLASIDTLLTWYPDSDPVRRKVLLPYIESYWTHAVQSRRFEFSTPALSATAVVSALTAPESVRIRAILAAASTGFRIRGDGLDDVVRRLRVNTPEMLKLGVNGTGVRSDIPR